MNVSAFRAMRSQLDKAIRDAVRIGSALVFNRRGQTIGMIVYRRGQVSPFRFLSLSHGDKTTTMLAALRS